MITNYYTNEPIDYLSVTKGMQRDEIVKVVEMGQSVFDQPNVSQYIPKLEQKYLHKQFIEQLTKLDLNKSLKELMDDTQTIIDGTKFTRFCRPYSGLKLFKGGIIGTNAFTGTYTCRPKASFDHIPRISTAG